MPTPTTRNHASAGAVRRGVGALLSCLALAAAALVGLPGQAGAAGSRSLLSDQQLLYPRVIRLSHSGSANGQVIATATSFPSGGAAGAVFASTDGGAKFSQVSTVPDTLAASTGLCCTTIYELPQQVGQLSAGTLLWAGSVGQNADNRRMSLRVWTSTDAGRSWSYLSTIATSPSTGGLWEPDFAIDGDGNLSAYYSDETHSGHSQVLVQSTSSDGVNWSAGRVIIAGPDSNDRPGMATVAELPSGAYLLTFEVCGLGGSNDCEVHWRTSTNAVGWGDASDLGPKLVATDGHYWTGDPTFAVTPSGRVVGTAQVQRNADGSPASGNGTTLWSAPIVGTGVQTGLGAVTEIASPYQVTAEPGVCPNYSTSLLPATDGSSVLQIATDYPNGDRNACRAYIGSGALANG